MTSKKKIILFSLSGLLVLIVLSMLLLPGIAKNYLVKNSDELIGRKVTIDQLALNYFSGTVSVYDFKMFEANEKGVFASFDTLIVNTVPYKYLSNIKALDQFYLNGLTVNISKKDSVYNFDDLVAFHMTEDSTEVSTEEDETFKYILNNLELKRATFNFYDGDVDHTTSIDDLSFFVPQIYWDQENHSNADVKFNIANNGSIESIFNVFPKTGDFDGEIEVKGLPLSSFYKYAAQYANINAINGTLGSIIELKGNIDTPENIQVSSEVTVKDFEVKDTKDQTFLAFDTFTSVLPVIDPMKKSIVVQSVVIERPYIKFELDSVSNNYSRILNVPSESTHTEKDSVELAQSNQKSDSSASYSYAVNTFEVNDGKMDYTDNLTGSPFDYQLSAISVRSDSISSDSEWVDVQSDMLLNDRGTLQAEVGLNPMSPLNAQIDIAIENFLLSDLNIYSNYYAGHSVLDGDMFYFSDSKLTEGKIESDNHLLIKNVDVRNNKGGLFAIPLKFAVWILKDKNGDIELDVPVAGDVSDPQVDTWDLVWTTLKKKIFNATDNPVKPLARYIGAKPEDIETIAFTYPDTLITEEQGRQLDLILDLEMKKEGLGVEMNFLADPKRLDSLIAQQPMFKIDSTQLSLAKDDKDLPREFPLEIPTDSLQPTGVDNSQATSSPRLDSLRADYTKAVINNVSKYLSEKNPQTQIVVQKGKISNSDHIDSETRIKVSYTMKDEDEEEDENEEVPLENNKE